MSVKTLVMLLGIVACGGATLNVPPVEPDEFHFVVLGDSQFHDPTKFNRVIDQTRRLRPAFVIQVGDLIKGYNNDLQAVKEEWQRFSHQVAPLAPIHFLPIPGNHDVYNGKRKVDAEMEALFEQTWGPLYFSFVYKNTLIVGLNSDSTEGANQISGKQMSWLQQTLAQSSAQHKFIFMHRPPLLIKNAEALHQLFKTQGVSHVFYGHHHHYHFFERDGIAYTMTNAAANSEHDSDEVGGFHHLLQVSVRGSEVDVAVIEADAIKARDAVAPQDNYDFFALSQKLAPSKVKLAAHGDNAHEFIFDIKLNNDSGRDVQLLVSCDSQDGRWQISPKVIEPITLSSKKRHTLSLTAAYSPDRQPESVPVCHLRVPFQTRHGVWIEYEQDVTGQVSH